MIPAIRLRRALPAAAATLLCLLGSSSTAHAGDFDAFYCSGPTDQPLSLRDWASPAPSIYFDHGAPNSCGATGGSFGITADSQVGYRGDRVSWRLDAPDGLTIVAVGGSYRVDGSAKDAAAGVDGISVCAPWGLGPEQRGTAELSGFIFGCPDADGFTETQPVRPLPAPAASISAYIACAAPVADPACGTGPVSLKLSRVQVRYHDDVSPIAQLPLQGDLVAPGNLSGMRSVQAPLRDVGGGVKTVRIYLDGGLAGESLPLCAEPYTRAGPCPKESTVGAAVDTRRVTDGAHQLKITGVDVAGNEGVLWDAPVLIDNGGPRGPGSDSAIRGELNGTPALDDNRITATWPQTARNRSSRTATRRACRRSATYRAKHPLACNGRPAGRTLTTRYSLKHQSRLEGVLTTATGAPVRGAAIRLTSTPTASGAQPRELGVVSTDDRGHFQAAIPRKDGSATITAAWYARSRDTNPVALVSLQHQVRAASTFRATAHTIRRGHVVRFFGLLLGNGGPRGGSTVTIQAANRPGNWRTVSSIRVAPNGHWGLRYRIPHALRGTYKFRGQVQPAPTYPYRPATTRTRKLAVR